MGAFLTNALFNKNQPACTYDACGLYTPPYSIQYENVPVTDPKGSLEFLLRTPLIVYL